MVRTVVLQLSALSAMKKPTRVASSRPYSAKTCCSTPAWFSPVCVPNKRGKLSIRVYRLPVLSTKYTMMERKACYVGDVQTSKENVILLTHDAYIECQSTS